MRACCCLPAGATLTSCIPVGIRIIHEITAFCQSTNAPFIYPKDLYIKLNFLLNSQQHAVQLISKHRLHEISDILLISPKAQRDSTSAPQHPSVTLKEEEEEQRSLHQTPEPKQWELGVDSPRRSHLPRREWSPFVSYCGMWRQIDEGRVIPLGPGEAAGSAASPNRHHKGTPSPSVSTLSSHMTQQPDATNLGK